MVQNGNSLADPRVYEHGKSMFPVTTLAGPCTVSLLGHSRDGGGEMVWLESCVVHCANSAQVLH